MKKSTHPLMHLLCMLALMLAMSLLSSLIYLLLESCGVDVAQGVGMSLWQALSQLLVFLLPVVLTACIYYRGREGAFLGLDFSGRAWGRAVAGVVTLLLMVPAIDWLTAWNDGWQLGTLGEYMRKVQEKSEATMAVLLGGTSGADLALNLVAVALVPALCEEVFFRAGVQNLLRRWWGPRAGMHLAVVATAALFSLVHLEIYAFVPRFVHGLLLGYLYFYGGSLVVNVAAHFVNNAVIVLLYWLHANGLSAVDPVQPFAVPWLVTLCCTLAALTLFYTSFLMSRPRDGMKKGE